MTFLADFLAAAAAVVGWELVKQIGLVALRRRLPPAVAAGLLALDRLLPQILAEGITGDQLEGRIRAELGELTGSDWTTIRRRFDPVAFVEHNCLTEQ